MATPTSQQIADRLDEIPLVVHEMISSDMFSNQMAFICKSHGIRLDQAGELVSKLYFFMLGFETPESFRQAVKAVVGDDAKTEEMVSEINNVILAPIREALAKEQAEEARKEDLLHGDDSHIEALLAEDSEEAKQSPVAPLAENPLPARDELISQIEQPAKTPVHIMTEPVNHAPSALVAEKLSVATAVPPTTTDYSVKSSTQETMTSPVSRLDPYKEQI